MHQGQRGTAPVPLRVAATVRGRARVYIVRLGTIGGIALCSTRTYHVYHRLANQN
jgi:hypothetical protein